MNLLKCVKTLGNSWQVHFLTYLNIFIPISCIFVHIIRRRIKLIINGWMRIFGLTGAHVQVRIFVLDRNWTTIAGLSKRSSHFTAFVFSAYSEPLRMLFRNNRWTVDGRSRTYYLDYLNRTWFHFFSVLPMLIVIRIIDILRRKLSKKTVFENFLLALLILKLSYLVSIILKVN